MQALEDEEDTFRNAAAQDQCRYPARRTAILALCLGRNMDLGRLLSPELEGIANQILKQLQQLGLVGQNRGQRVVSNEGLVLGYS